MIVGREQLRFFEDLEKQQKRIWPDACDSGVLLDTQKLRDVVRQNLQFLLDTFEAEVYKNGMDRTYYFFIPFEMDGGVYSGVRCLFQYSMVKYQGYDWPIFAITFKHDTQEESGFKN